MPRSGTPVNRKTKGSSKVSAPKAPWIDLHFHGAYGVDLMGAEPSAVQAMARRLRRAGVAAFCPTTLTAPHPELCQAIVKLGAFTCEQRQAVARGLRRDESLSLGLHLEGPFLSPKACGAHPPGALQPFSFKTLEEFWRLSSETLRILTIAPELLEARDLKRLGAWAKERKVTLSAGHSRATTKQAHAAFEAGFRGVTHAWNAMAFSHREPGILGASLAYPNVYWELISDQVHVAPETVQLSVRARGPEQVCLVSDCTPAGGTRAGVYSFGPIAVHRKEGASRIATGEHAGALAGGGDVLPTMIQNLIKRLPELAQFTRAFRQSPARALGLSAFERRELKLRLQR